MGCRLWRLAYALLAIRRTCRHQHLHPATQWREGVRQTSAPKPIENLPVTPSYSQQLDGDNSLTNLHVVESATSPLVKFRDDKISFAVTVLYSTAASLWTNRSSKSRLRRSAGVHRAGSLGAGVHRAGSLGAGGAAWDERGRGRAALVSRRWSRRPTTRRHRGRYTTTDMRDCWHGISCDGLSTSLAGFRSRSLLVRNAACSQCGLLLRQEVGDLLAIDGTRVLEFAIPPLDLRGCRILVRDAGHERRSENGAVSIVDRYRRC